MTNQNNTRAASASKRTDAGYSSSSGDTFGKVAAHLRGSAAVPRSSSMRPDASDAVRAKAAQRL